MSLLRLILKLLPPRGKCFTPDQVLSQDYPSAPLTGGKWRSHGGYRGPNINTLKMFSTVQAFVTSPRNQMHLERKTDAPRPCPVSYALTCLWWPGRTVEQDAHFSRAFPIDEAKEDVLLQSGGSSDSSRLNTVCHEVPANLWAGPRGGYLAGRPLCVVSLIHLSLWPEPVPWLECFLTSVSLCSDGTLPNSAWQWVMLSNAALSHPVGDL